MLDGDGVQQGVPFPVALQLTVAGDRIRVAFEGTSESRGGPVNLPSVGTMSAVRCALKGLTLPTDPTNEGHFLAIDFDLTPGTAVTPERPAPTDSYGYLVVAICELTVRALATAVPERCPAGGSQFAIVYLYRSDPRQGAPYIMVDPVDAGSGGRPFEDAPTLGVLGNGDVPNTPVEVLENRYPIVCERSELNAEVAGAGTFRGGFGSRRDYRVLENGTLVNVGLENARHPLGRGLDGGEDGGAARVVITRAADGAEEVIQDKVAGWGPLAAGDIVSMRSAGGAGWRSPLGRDPDQVARDVRDEWITVEEAADVYGVAVHEEAGTWKVDAAATARLRAGAG
jgi:N-methylhydantoinase B